MHKDKSSFKYAQFVIKFKWLILIFSLLTTLFFALQIKNIDIRNDPDTLLPQTNRYVSTNNFVEGYFGMANLFVVSVEVKEGDIYQPWFVNMTQEIHNKVAAMETANTASFISIAAQKVKNMGVTDDGSLSFKRLIPNTGISIDDDNKAKEQLDFMKEGLDNNPVLKPMIIHEIDPKTGEKCFNNEVGCIAKATFIIADFNNGVKEQYVPWVREVVKIIEPYSSDERVNVSIAGEPYFLAWMMVQLIDHWYLFVLSIIIAFIILFIETKSIRGAIFPLAGVAMSIIWTLGLMGLTGFKLTTMMVLTPMLILAVGMGHAIQITRRYMKARKDGETNVNGAYLALGFTIVPAVLSIVTDALGFATLASVDISFYKAYAYFGMFGMFSLLITTSTLIPVLMLTFPNKEDRLEEASKPLFTNKSSEGYAWEKKLGEIVLFMNTGAGRIIPLSLVFLILATSWHYTKISEGISTFIADERPFTQKVKLAVTSDDLDIMPGVEKGIDYAQAAFKVDSGPVQDIFHLNKLMPGVISFSIPIRGKKAIFPECTDEFYEVYDVAVEAGTKLPEKKCYDPDNDPAQGIMNDASVINAIAQMEKAIRKNKFIGFTASYSQYINIANLLLMSEGNTLNFDNFRIPTKAYLTQTDPDDDRDPSDIISTYNGLLDMASSPGDLTSMVGQDYNSGVILGFINTMHPKETHEAVLFLQDYIEAHKNDAGFNQVNFGYRNADENGDVGEIADDSNENYVKPGIGGFLGATEATREVTYANWIMNPLGTALAIFIVATLIFRSFLMSSFLMTILGITLFAQYGLAGYFSSVENWSGNLHFGNLVTLSIAMGLGVDYSIYMISKLRDEYQEHGIWSKALKNSVATTGSSVLISVIVLIGAFIPLMATDLGNTWGLSVYITEAVIIDVFTSLTLLPILLFIFKPKYIFDRK
ncbi:MAG: Putative RND superfamily exporter [uncultured Sulfurovum sp.]|uniref:RND superfamily exporter n=1 Tax=uncultured Sulfurovum sp. TaxID=269237 RepID=A0A6S6U4Q5_9BACT|nr:MAG: Putative RND superfamily exporter [uncultured Sulfurovum sp.]